MGVISYNGSTFEKLAPPKITASSVAVIFYPSHRLGISSAFYEYISQKASISSRTASVLVSLTKDDECCQRNLNAKTDIDIGR